VNDSSDTNTAAAWHWTPAALAELRDIAAAMLADADLFGASEATL
jgi:hypothetical protein